MSDNTARIRGIFRSKTSRALDRIEDPREMLDDAYDQQVRMLQQLRQGLAEVATAKKRIELQGQELGGRYERLAAQARQALDQDREDLARTALQRRSTLEKQVASLRSQYNSLSTQQSRLEENERRVSERIAAFRLEKETLKATYTASQAQVRVNEALAGLGAQLDDAGASVDRAKDKVAHMQARAAATDELIQSGALRDLTGGADEDLDWQLASAATRSDIERQLREMRGAAGSEEGQQGPDAWLSIAP
jgi:phage shock protein A